ncbi:MAG: DUF255 domain-containing protein [Pseudomonadota bacterium]
MRTLMAVSMAVSMAVALWTATFTAAMAEALLPKTPASLSQGEGAALIAAWRSKGSGYTPRTHRLHSDGTPRFVNRLITETSPYLVQHAHNPVDWRPWGPDALAEAQATGKPIFLSVGYATCHWCHVMEEESFDTEIVANVLNRDFIAVKVDREQRPEIDQTYMLATMMLMGRGGWPNSVFLTPEGKPFYAGTYWPQTAFLEVLDAVSLGWTEQRPAVEGHADEIAGAILDYTTAQTEAAALDERVHSAATSHLIAAHNALQGGFSLSVQFPQEIYLTYLLDRWRRTGDPATLEVVRTTLDQIEAGGIHDHIGGGFHRYTVDPNWRTPHFEKMLYNQAQLASVFAEAWAITGAPRYARAVRRSFEYVLREMRAPDGAFYSAEDADSAGLPGTERAGERVEGAFYVWTPEQVRDALAGRPAEEIDTAIRALGLHTRATMETGTVAHRDPDLEPDPALDPVLDALRTARDARPRPLRDEKIIAGWNGLMIRALAEGGAAFAEQRYTFAAAAAAQGIWSRLWRDGALSRLYTNEQVAPIEGALEDYAWLGLGFVALSDATGDGRWLSRAAQLADALEARFSDPSGRLRTSKGGTPLGPLFAPEDGATPAGESAALELFAALSLRREDVTNGARAQKLLAALSGRMAERPIDRINALQTAAMVEGGDSRTARPLVKGKVRARAEQAGETLRVRLTIAPGWHVNAHEPGYPDVIPLGVSGATVTAVRYPVSARKSFGFAEAEIAVHEADATVEIDLAPPDDEADPRQGRTVTLTVQACSDTVCLAPEDATFRVLPR